MDEDTLKKVVTIFIDILVKKKDLVQFSKHCFELPCQSDTQKCYIINLIYGWWQLLLTPYGAMIFVCFIAGNTSLHPLNRKKEYCETCVGTLNFDVNV